MIDMNLSEKESLIALLPFYLSGEIGKLEARQVEAWLRTDPQAPAILEKISEERHVNAISNEALRAPTNGLARLLADVAVTPQEKTLQAEGANLLGWLKETALAPLKAAPTELAWAVCGLLMLVTVGQSYVLYQGPGAPTKPGYELAGGAQYQVLSTAVVKFVDDASMGAIADVLDEAGAVMIDGPTASGQFTIGFIAREGAPAVSERLKALKNAEGLIAFIAVKESEPLGRD